MNIMFKVFGISFFLAVPIVVVSLLSGADGLAHIAAGVAAASFFLMMFGIFLGVVFDLD